MASSDMMHLREELIVALQIHVAAHELRNGDGLGLDKPFHIGFAPPFRRCQEQF